MLIVGYVVQKIRECQKTVEDKHFWRLSMYIKQSVCPPPCFRYLPDLGPCVCSLQTLMIQMRWECAVMWCLLPFPDGASNGSDSKKLRVEEAPPSRVLHIRKLPNEATETEIIALGLPFGKVTNILTLKGKNQVKHTWIYTKSVSPPVVSQQAWNMNDLIERQIVVKREVLPRPNCYSLF